MQERGGEQTLYVTEYMQRRELSFGMTKKCVPAEKKGGIDAVTKEKDNLHDTRPYKIPIAHTTTEYRRAAEL